MAQILPLRRADEPADDAALVERAAQGEVLARRELYLRHAPRLLAMLVRLLGSRADAEDAAQDAFIEAFRDLSGLRHDFSRWLTRVAVHQAHRRFRRRRFWAVFGQTPELDAKFDELIDDGVSPERRAELSLLDTRLRKLPALERTIWVLRHVEGLELTEIADATEVSLATVKRKLAWVDERLAQWKQGGRS